MISQFFTAPNQLTFLRLVFIPFIVITILDRNYRWALGLFVLAGLSDFLDGLLARRLHQRTRLGEYLDPIADKLLLSTLFLVLSFMQLIPWKVTILVFSRDVGILVSSAVLYAVSNLRDFRPSVFGKANTLAQILAVLAALLYETSPADPLWYAKGALLWATAALTVISGVHYVFLASARLKAAHG